MNNIYGLKNKEEIIEPFHTDITEEVNEYNPYPKPEGSSMTAQYACIKRNKEERPWKEYSGGEHVRLLLFL